MIRLFGTKQQLFLAALESVCDRLEQAFRDAAEREPTLISLSSSFETMLSEEEVLRILLHGCSASAEPAIGDVVRERFARVYRMVRDLTGASPAQAREFLGSGVLLTAMSAIDPRLGGGSPAPWADELMASLDSTGDQSDMMGMSGVWRERGQVRERRSAPVRRRRGASSGVANRR